MLSSIRFVTLGVSDLERSLALYRDVIGFRVDREASLGQTEREAWALPAGTEGRIVELSCRGYPTGMLRLVQYKPQATVRVRDDGVGGRDGALDIGPKAIDFYVRDPIHDAMARLAAAGLEARSAPVKHQLGEIVSEELVYEGPDGVPILIMVGHVHPPDSLRPGSPEGAFSELATVSIVTADLDACRRFYGETLGLALVSDQRTPPEHLERVARLTGTPPGPAVSWLLYTAQGEPSGKVLLICFHTEAPRRLVGRMRPGHLGFSLLTYGTRELEGVLRRLEAGGYRVRRAAQGRALVEGPNEELLELVAEA